MKPEVCVLLYPGCVFFEIALATETLAAACTIRCLTPDGADHAASNGARLRADAGYAALQAGPAPAAVLVPGGDPRAILLPRNLAREPLQAALAGGALLAGICAGNLVLAAAGVLRGRRATHNYAPPWAAPEQVAATAAYWEGMHYEAADLVEDGPVITAMPWAYRRYAAAVARQLAVLDAVAARDLESYVQRRSLHTPGGAADAAGLGTS